jgi:hypothetical protein
MPNVINGTSTGSGGLITSGDDSGILNIQTNETTAMSIDASQSVDFTNNIDAPNTFGFKNRLINSGMVIDQRNAGAAVTLTATTASYITDRWYCNNTSEAVLSVTRDTSAPSGFTNSTKVTVSTADASIGATQNSYFAQWIEGYNSADLAWGTASASTVTLSFWVRSSLTGTFGGALTNSAIDRSYPFTYSISSANTWEQKSITVVGDTSGTWLKDNGVGLRVWFALGTGSTYTGTAGAWAGAEYRGATGQTQIISTVNATWQVTGVQLEKGTQATSFDFRSIGTETALCQRYYTKMTTGGGVYTGFSLGYQISTTSAICTMKIPMTMRSAPTLNQSNCAINDTQAFTVAITSITGVYAGPDTARFIANWSGAYGALYRPIDLIANNNSAAFFEISAEL